MEYGLRGWEELERRLRLGGVLDLRLGLLRVAYWLEDDRERERRLCLGLSVRYLLDLRRRWSPDLDLRLLYCSSLRFMSIG